MLFLSFDTNWVAKNAGDTPQKSIKATDIKKHILSVNSKQLWGSRVCVCVCGGGIYPSMQQDPLGEQSSASFIIKWQWLMKISYIQLHMDVHSAARKHDIYSFLYSNEHSIMEGNGEERGGEGVQAGSFCWLNGAHRDTKTETQLNTNPWVFSLDFSGVDISSTFPFKFHTGVIHRDQKRILDILLTRVSDRHHIHTWCVQNIKNLFDPLAAKGWWK